MNILSVMDRACTTLNDEGLFNPGDDLCKARRAVAELIEASERTIRAFEALGNANSVLPTRLAHMECESAMVAQKAALANVGSAS